MNWRIPATPLTAGVSSQPFPIREPFQTTSCDNTNLFIQRGLEKRFGTVREGSNLNITGASSIKWKTHWIEREQEDKFLVMIDSSQATDANIIQIFDLAGNKKTITSVVDGGDDPLNYLKVGTGDSKNKLFLLTVGETTFIVNKEVVTAKTGLAPDYPTDTGGDSLTAQSNLKFPNDGLSITAGDWEVDDVINLISAVVGYPVGFYKVIADPTNSGDPAGPWYERIPPNQPNNEIDKTTFPVRLIYDATLDEFTLEFTQWSQRLSGDDVTNPGPRFLGEPIKTVAVFEDRMWFGAGNYVVSSQAGDLFNLWIDDWTNVIDSDPIDLLLMEDNSHTVQHLVPFQKTLLVLAENGKQFEIKSNNAFTPVDTNLIPTTNYRTSPDATPAKMNQQLYFVSEQGDFSYAWEYFYNLDFDSNIGVNISQHVEGYLPLQMREIVSSENDGLILFRPASEPNHLYVHFVHWNASQKSQSSWCRWVYDSNVEIFSIAVINGDLYLLMKNGANFWFEYQPLSKPLPDADPAGSLSFRLHMDRKLSVIGVYNGTTKQTLFTLPFLDAQMDTVILGPGFGNKAGQEITSTVGSAGGFTTLTVNGNFGTHRCFIGKSYNMRVELSKIFPKDEGGQTIFGTYQVYYADMYLRDTTSLDIAVTPPGRSTRTSRFLANKFGSAIFGKTGVKQFASHRVHIRGRGSDTVILLQDDSPFQTEITNLEFIGDLQASARNPAT